MRKAILFGMIIGLSGITASLCDAVTIYEVQYSELPDYVSPLNGQTVDIEGGIVTKLRTGDWNRYVIQDPTLEDAWAAVIVKIDPAYWPVDIEEGDEVYFFGVTVEEYRGNTECVYGSGSSFQVLSEGNVVAPLVVPTSAIPFPVDHEMSEKYEHMLLTVEGVTVGTMGLGKAGDNYELISTDGTCWASDYVNYERPPESDYYVVPGGCYGSITGYLEQYTKLESGWDYYQLLPRWIDDYVPGASAVDATSWSGVKAMFK